MWNYYLIQDGDSFSRVITLIYQKNITKKFNAFLCPLVPSGPLAIMLFTDVVNNTERNT